MGLLTAKDKAEMAVRAEKNRKDRIEAVREQIQVAAIVKMLQDHALGKGRMKMTPARIKAAEMLLERSMPPLAVEKGAAQGIQVTLNISTNFTPQQQPLPKVEIVDG